MPLFEDVYPEVEFTKNSAFRMRVELPQRLLVGEFRRWVAKAAGLPEDEADERVRLFAVDYYPKKR